MKKSELQQIIREEIQKVLNEALLKNGDRVIINKKLGNIFSRTLDVNPLDWPNEGKEYTVTLNKQGTMYGFIGDYGNEKNTTRWHDIKWIDSEIGRKKISKI